MIQYHYYHDHDVDLRLYFFFLYHWNYFAYKTTLNIQYITIALLTLHKGFSELFNNW